MKSVEVHLGYEVSTGNPVLIPVRNMVVTGQTQEAGKTTALEGLVSRMDGHNFSAIAFVTKRGERSFQEAVRVQPYMRERADWQFVASILEATMRERMKFERSWIIQASKGARDLAGVQANVRRALTKAKGLSESVYLTLDAYLDIVVPRLQRVEFADGVDFTYGGTLRVMDISDRESFPAEIQMLVIRSVLELIYEEQQRTITLIPEAWEFLPQNRGSPVKLAATELIRKGSGLQNYVWLDSQDIGGIDKEILRSCPVWLLGVQREANEIERVLKNIPAGIAKPKAAEIAMLEKGQFYACHGKTVVKVYAQPAWMKAAQAEGIARGYVRLDEVPMPVNRAPPKKETHVSNNETPSLLKSVGETNAKIDKLTSTLERFVEMGMKAQATATQITGKVPVDIKPGPIVEVPGNQSLEQIYDYVVARLRTEAPEIIHVIAHVPEIKVTEQIQTIETDSKSLYGQIAILVSEGYFDEEPVNGNRVHTEVRRRFGYGGTSNVRSYEQLDNLHKQGFLTKEKDGYKAVPRMKKHIRRVEA